MDQTHRPTGHGTSTSGRMPLSIHVSPDQVQLPLPAAAASSRCHRKRLLERAKLDRARDHGNWSACTPPACEVFRLWPCGWARQRRKAGRSDVLSCPREGTDPAPVPRHSGHEDARLAVVLDFFYDRRRPPCTWDARNQVSATEDEMPCT